MKHVTCGLVCGIVALTVFTAGLGSVDAQRQLRVGNMWDEVGNEERGGWGGKGMAFPGGFFPRNLTVGGVRLTLDKGTTAYHGHSIGMRNFTPTGGDQMAFAVAQNTIQSAQQVGYDRIAVSGTKLYWQQEPPTVIVDGSVLVGESVDEVNPNLASDAMIELEWTNALGITGTLQAHAFVNRKFDEFNIRDYRFVNNGNADGDNTTIEYPNRDIEGFFWVVDFWPLDRAEGGSTWGHAAEWAGDAYVQYYGGLRGVNRYLQWVESGGTEGDSLRVMYGWDGDSQRDPRDDRFDPHPETGRLLSAKFPGLAVIHADRAYNDTEDWPQQPIAMRAKNFVVRDHRVKHGDEQVYRFNFGGDNNPDLSPDSPWYDPSNWQLWEEGELEAEDPNANVGYGMIGSITMGPYDIPFGEDVRIVNVYAVGGMDFERTKVVGAQYASGEITSAEKDAIAWTYFDTLLNNVSLAKWAFQNDFNVPDSPPAPDLTVNSGPARIDIEWSDVSSATDRDSGVADFLEYRLYRAQGSFWGDMPFEMVYSGTGRSYTDTDVIRGFNYYYYVTAVDDGTQNFFEPGVQLESGMHHNRTSAPAVPFRAPFAPGATQLSEGEIRAVPNPWEASDLDNKFGAPGTDEFRKIMFVNLPGDCTIRIYTEAGDLVRTIEHGGGATLPSGDEFWDQITDFNQEVVSGIYVAVIDSDQGTDVVKFVIVK